MNEGETWVLLRGLAREQRHWGDFADRLRSQTGATRIVALDLPGNGSRHAEASPMQVETMVDSARAELRERGLAAPYRLVALSLGAMVAIEWAARHPGELCSAVLVNTSARPFARWHERLRPRAAGALVAAALTGDVEARERAVLRLTSAHPGRRVDALLADWSRWQRERPVARASILRQLVAAARYRAPVSAPRVPVLVLASAADRLVDPVCSRRLAEAWRVELRIHPSAGHDLPLDDGAWIVAQIAGWLASRPTSGRESGVSRRGNAGDSAAAGPGNASSTAGRRS